MSAIRKRELRFSAFKVYQSPLLKGFYKPQADNGPRAKRRRPRKKKK